MDGLLLFWLLIQTRLDIIPLDPKAKPIYTQKHILLNGISRYSFFGMKALWLL